MPNSKELPSKVMRLSGYVCVDCYTACPVLKITALHSLHQLRQTKGNCSFSLIHFSEKRADVWEVKSIRPLNTGLSLTGISTEKDFPECRQEKVFKMHSVLKRSLSLRKRQTVKLWPIAEYTLHLFLLI